MLGGLVEDVKLAGIVGVQLRDYGLLCFSSCLNTFVNKDGWIHDIVHNPRLTLENHNVIPWLVNLGCELKINTFILLYMIYVYIKTLFKAIIPQLSLTRFTRG
jgi:hypothetical protein